MSFARQAPAKNNIFKMLKINPASCKNERCQEQATTPIAQLTNENWSQKYDEFCLAHKNPDMLNSGLFIKFIDQYPSTTYAELLPHLKNKLQSSVENIFQLMDICRHVNASVRLLVCQLLENKFADLVKLDFGFQGLLYLFKDEEQLAVVNLVEEKFKSIMQDEDQLIYLKMMCPTLTEELAKKKIISLDKSSAQSEDNRSFTLK